MPRITPTPLTRETRYLHRDGTLKRAAVRATVRAAVRQDEPRFRALTRRSRFTMIREEVATTLRYGALNAKPISVEPDRAEHADTFELWARHSGVVA